MMTNQSPVQMPLSTHGGSKSDVRTQFAALCWRRRPGDGKIEVLLVTSRGIGRWIVPKGWPIDGRTPAQTAAREAWEEAGAKGKALDRCIGLYSYAKWLGPDDDLPVVVAVFPVEVDLLSVRWPEGGQRKRRWFRPKKAAQKVDEPELAAIIAGFDPSIL